MHARYEVVVMLGTSGATMHVRYSMWVVVWLGTSGGHFAHEVQNVGCG